MPLVRIDLLKGKPREYRAEVGEIVYQCLMDNFGVPLNDKFQVIAEHAEDELIFDRNYLGISRTNDCIFIQITMSSGRTVEKKQAFYKAVADRLHEKLKLRREAVFVKLVEVGKENWSFGNGIAQYVAVAANQ